MRKIVAYIAMSLDGYIADENQGVSWLSGDGSDEENAGSYSDFIETIDTIILGYTTYHQIVTELSPDTWVYAGKQSYVLTHRKPENTKDVTFIEEDVVSLTRRLKTADGKNIWICGGASVINQFQRRGLIDEYVITLIPTILGKGIRLFEGQEAEQKLRLLSVRNYNGIVDVTYEKRP